jgi:hypothetical protein
LYSTCASPSTGRGSGWDERGSAAWKGMPTEPRRACHRDRCSYPQGTSVHRASRRMERTRRVETRSGQRVALKRIPDASPAKAGAAAERSTRLNDCASRFDSIPLTSLNREGRRSSDGRRRICRRRCAGARPDRTASPSVLAVRDASCSRREPAADLPSPSPDALRPCAMLGA